jgi:hypothetical protein
MLKLYKKLAKPIDISLSVLIYSCLEGASLPIGKREALEYIRTYNRPLEVLDIYEFIYRWFERTDNRRLKERGQQLVNKLIKDDSKVLRRRMRSPIVLSLACGGWERSSIELDRAHRIAVLIDEFLELWLCEHILYPLEGFDTPHWLLKFYIDIATYLPPLIGREQIEMVVRDKERGVDIEALLYRLEEDCLLIPIGDSYGWIDNKIPLMLRGIDRRLRYKYEVFKRMSNLFSSEVGS